MNRKAEEENLKEKKDLSMPENSFDGQNDIKDQSNNDFINKCSNEKVISDSYRNNMNKDSDMNLEPYLNKGLTPDITLYIFEIMGAMKRQVIFRAMSKAHRIKIKNNGILNLEMYELIELEDELDMNELEHLNWLSWKEKIEFKTLEVSKKKSKKITEKYVVYKDPVTKEMFSIYSDISEFKAYGFGIYFLFTFIKYFGFLMFLSGIISLIQVILNYFYLQQSLPTGELYQIYFAETNSDLTKGSFFINWIVQLFYKTTINNLYRIIPVVNTDNQLYLDQNNSLNLEKASNLNTFYLILDVLNFVLLICGVIYFKYKIEVERKLFESVQEKGSSVWLRLKFTDRNFLNKMLMEIKNEDENFSPISNFDGMNLTVKNKLELILKKIFMNEIFLPLDVIPLYLNKKKFKLLKQYSNNCVRHLALETLREKLSVDYVNNSSKIKRVDKQIENLEDKKQQISENIRLLIKNKTDDDDNLSNIKECKFTYLHIIEFELVFVWGINFLENIKQVFGIIKPYKLNYTTHKLTRLII